MLICSELFTLRENRVLQSFVFKCKYIFFISACVLCPFKCNLYLGLLWEILEHFPYNRGDSYSINWFSGYWITTVWEGIVLHRLSIQGELWDTVWFDFQMWKKLIKDQRSAHPLYGTRHGFCRGSVMWPHLRQGNGLVPVHSITRSQG